MYGCSGDEYGVLIQSSKEGAWLSGSDGAGDGDLSRLVRFEGLSNVEVALRFEPDLYERGGCSGVAGTSSSPGLKDGRGGEICLLFPFLGRA